MVTNHFWENGYCVVEEALDQPKVALTRASLVHETRNRPVRDRIGSCIGTARDYYSPGLGEMMLRHCQPKFEAAIGRALLPSYAYCRIYEGGALLKRHVDRRGCEISVSLPIGCEPDGFDWPIMVVDKSGATRSISLKPGSALVFQGHEVEHWREPFGGQSQMQLLFHYVFADGEFADTVFDGRDIDPLETYYAVP